MFAHGSHATKLDCGVAARWSSAERARHWDNAYDARGVEGVSWHQPLPRASLRLIDELGVPPSAAVIDVGGGASFLVDRLVESGFSDLTVLDVSTRALDEIRGRLAPDAPVTLLQEDLLDWTPTRRYDLWHDRAVFHFLVDEGDRAGYLNVLRAACARDAALIIGTFAPEAPDMCSGLPVVRYAADDLVALLGVTFELAVATREEHATPRGAIQPFTWIAGRMRRSRGQAT